MTKQKEIYLINLLYIFLDSTHLLRLLFNQKNAFENLRCLAIAYASNGSLNLVERFHGAGHVMNYTVGLVVIHFSTDNVCIN